MKRAGVVSTAFLLFVLLETTALGYPRQEQQSEKQGRQEKQAETEKQKGTQDQDQNKQQRTQQKATRPAQEQPEHTKHSQLQ